MSNNPPRKEQPWLVFDDPKAALFAPILEGGDKKPKLSGGLYENNPRLRVRTNIQSDKANNNGFIDAAMDMQSFYALLDAIENLAKKQGPGQFFVENFGHPFLQGQRSREPKIVSKTQVKKGEDGMITISITAGTRRPVIEFPFMMSEYHHFKDENNQPMNLAMASRLACTGWCNMMRELMAAELSKHTAKPAWMQQGGQGGGGQQGGYQNNRQGGGGYNGGGNGGYQGGNNNGGGQRQQPAQDSYSFDDDVPI